MDIKDRYYVSEYSENVNRFLLNGQGEQLIHQEEVDKDEGVCIRLAQAEDIEQVKAIADANRHAIGFVVRASLMERICQKALFVAQFDGKIVGFLSFHHRRDGWTTLREICVASEYRRLGVGSRLLEALEKEVRCATQHGIRLKCPIDLPANGFYSAQKFQRIAIVSGKRRPLVVWEKRMLALPPLSCEVFSFYLTLTGRAYEIRRFVRVWQQSGDSRCPFARIILTPSFAPSATLRLVKEFKKTFGSIIIFDSGGYQVQMGKIAYEDLFSRLLHFYQEYSWADWYVLPDHVPCSQDSDQEVEYKVRETIEYARIFLKMMPAGFEKRAIGVVHGRTLEQMTRCIEAYADMGLSYIGFGSFGTSGPKGAINVISQRSVQLLQRIYGMALERGLRLHIFGVGNPTYLWRLAQSGIFPTSFDSAGWWKAGAFGNIFFPGGPQLHITAVRTPQTTLANLEYQKKQSGHSCTFCEDLRQMRRERLLRILHNLAATLDTVEQIQAYYAQNQSNSPVSSITISK